MSHPVDQLDQFGFGRDYKTILAYHQIHQYMTNLFEDNLMFQVLGFHFQKSDDLYLQI